MTRGPCTYCGFCERFGCEVGAKSDPTVTVIPLALKTGKFEIRMRSNAFQITNDGTTAKSVLYYDQNGAINEQPADIVIVASWVLNNARLLLMSKLGTPYDPVTATGQIGRNYAYQTGGGGATGYFKEKKFRRYMGSGALSTAIDDLNADNFDHSGLGFLGGGSVTAGASGARPIQSLSVPPGTPAFGRSWKVAIKQYYDRVMSVGFQGESPAYQTHFVDLDPNYRDNYGNPLLRITFDWEVNERKMVAYAGTKLLQIMQAINPDIIAAAPARCRPTTTWRRTSRPTTRAARSWAPTLARRRSTATCRCGTPRTCSSAARPTSRRTPGSTRRARSARSPTGPPRGSSSTTRRAGGRWYERDRRPLDHRRLRRARGRVRGDHRGRPELDEHDLEHYDGRWVAMREGRVVAHAADMETLQADPAVQGDGRRVPGRRPAVGLLHELRLSTRAAGASPRRPAQGSRVRSAAWSRSPPPAATSCSSCARRRVEGGRRHLARGLQLARRPRCP